MKRYRGRIFHSRALPSDARMREIDQLNRNLIACPACDAVWERPTLAPKEEAKCKRCHTTILTNKHRSAERTVAFMVASLVLYAVAISFPFMRMERSGLSNEISVIDAVAILANNSMVILALICAALILLFPLLRIILLLFVGLSLFRKQSTARPHALSFRLAQMLEPWTMAEIFMIGVIVSLVKVGKLADIYLGPAFWGMAALIVIMAFGASAVCRDTIWHDIRRVP
ncbi:MAG: paraquat-inducible protein A [Pseudomonadota bacterium]